MIERRNLVTGAVVEEVSLDVFTAGTDFYSIEGLFDDEAGGNLFVLGVKADYGYAPLDGVYFIKLSRNALTTVYNAYSYTPP